MKKALFLSTVILACTPPSFAENVGEVGAVFTYTHTQAGLSPSKIRVFPYFQKEYKNGWYAIVRQGFGKYVVQNKTTKLGVGLWMDMGRKSTHHIRLKDVAEVAPVLVVNINFHHKINNHYTIKGFTETAISGYKGSRAQLALVRRISADADSLLLVRGEVYAQFVDSKYAQAYYGINKPSGIYTKTYTAPSGIDRIGVRLSIQKNFINNMYIKGEFGIRSAQGPAKHSPISNQKTSPSIAIVFGTYF